MNTKKILTIDTIVLVVYLFAANPSITGVCVHEWLGLAALLALLLHASFGIGRAFSSKSANHVRVSPARIVLDSLLLLTLAVCVISGIMISGEVLRTFGFYAEGYFFWDPLHATSAKLLLSLLLIHIASHWKWFTLLFKKKK